MELGSLLGSKTNVARLLELNVVVYVKGLHEYILYWDAEQHCLESVLPSW
jgi:hypothetical protein